MRINFSIPLAVSGFLSAFFFILEKQAHSTHVFNQENEPGRQNRSSPSYSKILDEFLKTKKEGDPINLVVGCGRAHKPLTVADQPHNHEDAFTIDLGKVNALHYQVSDPHITADICDPTLLPTFPGKIFDTVTFEHLNTTILGPRQSIPLFSEINRILKPKGTFVFLSGGYDHRYTTVQDVKNDFVGAHFEVLEAAFMKKLPREKDLDRLPDLNKEEKQSLIWKTLSQPDPSLWRNLSPVDRQCFAGDLYQDYAYIKIVARRKESASLSDLNENTFELPSTGKTDTYSYMSEDNTGDEFDDPFASSED